MLYGSLMLWVRVAFSAGAWFNVDSLMIDMPVKPLAHG
jgi:hypothetical protein